MEHIKIHSEGPTFSRIITGVWRWQTLSGSEVQELVDASLQKGITTFDHADLYGNYTCEEIFGKAIEGMSSIRTKIQLVTKCGIRMMSDKKPEHRIKHYDTSKEHITKSVDQSLKNLKTDYLDLLLIHRPDPLLNPYEVAETFHALKESGKVLHFGVSNFTASQFELLHSYFSLVTNQVEISLFKNDPLFNGVVDTLMKHRVAPMVWSPLGGGKFFNESGKDDVGQQLNQLEKKYECSTSQLLLAWLLKHPSRLLPILGTTKAKRIEEGVGAIDIPLDRQDWFAMLKTVTGKDVP